MAYISAEQFKLAWPEIAAGAGIRQEKPRVGRTNSPSHALRRQGYRTIGEVCYAAKLSDSTLISWEGIHLPPMTKINGIRVVKSDEFAAYVESCIELREVRRRKPS